MDKDIIFFVQLAVRFGRLVYCFPAVVNSTQPVLHGFPHFLSSSEAPLRHFFFNIRGGFEGIKSRWLAKPAKEVRKPPFLALMFFCACWRWRQLG